MTGPAVTRHVQVDGTWYRPGDVPPERHARLITNPKAWGGTVPTFDEPAASGQFDPGEHTIPDVVDYLAGVPAEEFDAERDRVLAAERAGKARAGILGS